MNTIGASPHGDSFQTQASGPFAALQLLRQRRGATPVALSSQASSAISSKQPTDVVELRLMGETPPKPSVMVPTEQEADPVFPEVGGVAPEEEAKPFSSGQTDSAPGGDTPAEDPLTQAISEEAEDGGSAQESKTEKGDANNTSDPTRSRDASGEPLSDEEVRLIEDLERRDSEIRQHEQAHMAAAGGYARGGISFEYQTGPDGKRYAVGGEVDIDTSKENTPDATIRKMQAVKRAAMAPAEPSGQDRRVASMADQRISTARQEINEMRVRQMQAEMKARQERMGQENETAASMEEQDSQTAPPVPQVSSPSVPTEEGEEGNATQGVLPMGGDAEQPIVSSRQFAQRLQAVQAYQKAHRPEMLSPDGRAMQPAHPQNAGFGMITSLQPAPGSLADQLAPRRGLNIVA